MPPRDDKYTGSRDHHWFVQKRYGYGATPVTWQGWVITLIFSLLMVAVGLLPLPPVASFTLIAFLVAVLIIIVRAKTKGGFVWRWGTRGD